MINHIEAVVFPMVWILLPRAVKVVTLNSNSILCDKVCQWPVARL